MDFCEKKCILQCLEGMSHRYLLKPICSLMSLKSCVPLCCWNDLSVGESQVLKSSITSELGVNLTLHLLIFYEIGYVCIMGMYALELEYPLADFCLVVVK